MRVLAHYAVAMWAENIKEWKIELSYRFDFIRGLIQPFVYVLPYLLFGLAVVGGRNSESLKELIGTGDVITFVIIGYVFMGFLNTAMWGMGFALRKEQFYGTIESVFVAPVPRWVYVGGMALHSTMHQGLIIVVQMVLLQFIFRLTIDPSGLLPAMGVVALMLVALYGIGMMVASLALIYKAGWVIAESLHSVISVVTPIAYPLAVLPIFLQKAAHFLPTTYGILTMRHFLIGEDMGFSVASSLLRLSLLCVGWAAFGVFIFSVVDRKTRREGTLGHY
jgi:ABC-2 type transport system permease protein